MATMNGYRLATYPLRFGGTVTAYETCSVEADRRLYTVAVEQDKGRTVLWEHRCKGYYDLPRDAALEARARARALYDEQCAQWRLLRA